MESKIEIVELNKKPTLHMIGLFHTICNQKFSHCAYTGKVLRFAKMMRMYGYEVIEYSNGVSESEASTHIQMIPEDEFYNLVKRKKDTDFVGDDAVIGSDVWKAFISKLYPIILKNAKPGDIICHAFDRSYSDLSKMLPRCLHVETGIGYKGSFLAFRVFESYAWFHYALGYEKKDVGPNLNWVVPNYFDIDEWDVCLKPKDYVVFLGRIYSQKGLDTIVEVSKHVNKRFIICGQGDPTPYLNKGGNIEYKEPIYGRARSELLGNAYCCIMPTLFIEPFGGAGVEALLCGTPLLGSCHGAFTENIQHGENGFICHTLGDWIDGVKAVGTLDREKIARNARNKFSLQECGRKYDIIFKQLSNQFDKGWYTPYSHDIQGDIVKSLENPFDLKEPQTLKEESTVQPASDLDEKDSKEEEYLSTVKKLASEDV